ncbi:MAG: hypothetical protein FD143_3733, partial [Ignavibacteria bacterium]
MKFSRKNFQVYIRKSPWKIDFLTIFLLFSRVSEAVGEFFAFCFFPFAVWGDYLAGVEFRQGEGGGFPSPSPRVKVWLEDNTTFLQHFFRFPGGGRFRHGE